MSLQHGAPDSGASRGTPAQTDTGSRGYKRFIYNGRGAVRSGAVYCIAIQPIRVKRALTCGATVHTSARHRNALYPA